MFRKYSAFAVVASSATLVTATNLAAEGKTIDLLTGRWGETEISSSRNDMTFLASKDKQDNIIPLSIASKAVDPDAKQEDKNEFVRTNGQVTIASTSPVMKDPQEGEGVKVYTVQNGDTVSTIAATYGVTSNTILWANEIDDIDSIKPGDKIFILPVSGISYAIQKNDTLDAIAKKFEAKKEEIIAFNSLPADGDIKEGQEIIIPGGQKDEPEDIAPTNTNTIARRQYATPQGGTPKVSKSYKKLDGKAGTGHRFPYGYCTWYVAQKRYVPWGGNAGTWLYHARAMGYKTGKKPKVGAIMVSSESWWGHVAIVEKVKGSTITVSEMNYRGWGKTSRRTISTKNRVIKGYIY